MENSDFFGQLERWMIGQSDLALDTHDLSLLAESLTGRPPPARAPRQASITQLEVSRRVLRRVRDVVDGPLVLLKGLEVAMLYPNPSDRSFGDIDLLVPNADEVQEHLLASGAELLEQSASSLHVSAAAKHDLPPIAFPDLPIPIEIHRKLGCLSWTDQPPLEVLLARATTSAAGIKGVETLDPVDHSLFLIDHSWRHQPFHRIRDLVDIELMAQHAGPAAVAERAAEWRIDGVLRELQRAEDTLLRGRPPSLALRLFGKHFLQAASSSHASRITADMCARFFVAPPGQAARSLKVDITNRLQSNESFGAKARRVVRTARDVPAGQRVST